MDTSSAKLITNHIRKYLSFLYAKLCEYNKRTNSIKYWGADDKDKLINWNRSIGTHSRAKDHGLDSCASRGPMNRSFRPFLWNCLVGLLGSIVHLFYGFEIRVRLGIFFFQCEQHHRIPVDIFFVVMSLHLTLLSWPSQSSCCHVQNFSTATGVFYRKNAALSCSAHLRSSSQLLDSCHEWVGGLKYLWMTCEWLVHVYASSTTLMTCTWLANDLKKIWVPTPKKWKWKWLINDCWMTCEWLSSTVLENFQKIWSTHKMTCKWLTCKWLGNDLRANDLWMTYMQMTWKLMTKLQMTWKWLKCNWLAHDSYRTCKWLAYLSELNLRLFVCFCIRERLLWPFWRLTTLLSLLSWVSSLLCTCVRRGENPPFPWRTTLCGSRARS